MRPSNAKRSRAPRRVTSNAVSSSRKQLVQPSLSSLSEAHRGFQLTQHIFTSGTFQRSISSKSSTLDPGAISRHSAREKPKGEPAVKRRLNVENASKYDSDKPLIGVDIFTITDDWERTAENHKQMQLLRQRDRISKRENIALNEKISHESRGLSSLHSLTEGVLQKQSARKARLQRIRGTGYGWDDGDMSRRDNQDSSAGNSNEIDYSSLIKPTITQPFIASLAKQPTSSGIPLKRVSHHDEEHNDDYDTIPTNDLELKRKQSQMSMSEFTRFALEQESKRLNQHLSSQQAQGRGATTNDAQPIDFSFKSSKDYQQGALESFFSLHDFNEVSSQGSESLTHRSPTGMDLARPILSDTPLPTPSGVTPVVEHLSKFIDTKTRREKSEYQLLKKRIKAARHAAASQYMPDQRNTHDPESSNSENELPVDPLIKQLTDEEQHELNRLTARPKPIPELITSSKIYRDLAAQKEILHTLGVFLGTYDVLPGLAYDIQSLAKSIIRTRQTIHHHHELELTQLMIDKITNNEHLTERLAGQQAKGVYEYMVRHSRHATGAFGTSYDTDDIILGMQRSQAPVMIPDSVVLNITLNALVNEARGAFFKTPHSTPDTPTRSNPLPTQGHVAVKLPNIPESSIFATAQDNEEDDNDSTTAYGKDQRASYSKGMQLFNQLTSQQTAIEKQFKPHQHPAVVGAVRLLDYMHYLHTNPSVMKQYLIHRAHRVQQERIINDADDDAALNEYIAGMMEKKLSSGNPGRRSAALYRELEALQSVSEELHRLQEEKKLQQAELSRQQKEISSEEQRLSSVNTYNADDGESEQYKRFFNADTNDLPTKSDPHQHASLQHMQHHFDTLAENLRRTDVKITQMRSRLLARAKAKIDLKRRFRGLFMDTEDLIREHPNQKAYVKQSMWDKYAIAEDDFEDASKTTTTSDVNSSTPEQDHTSIVDNDLDTIQFDSKRDTFITETSQKNKAILNETRFDAIDIDNASPEEQERYLAMLAPEASTQLQNLHVKPDVGGFMPLLKLARDQSDSVLAQALLIRLYQWDILHDMYKEYTLRSATPAPLQTTQEAQKLKRLRTDLSTIKDCLLLGLANQQPMTFLQYSMFSTFWNQCTHTSSKQSEHVHRQQLQQVTMLMKTQPGINITINRWPDWIYPSNDAQIAQLSKLAIFETLDLSQRPPPAPIHIPGRPLWKMVSPLAIDANTLTTLLRSTTFASFWEKTFETAEVVAYLHHYMRLQSLPKWMSSKAMDDERGRLNDHTKLESIEQTIHEKEAELKPLVNQVELLELENQTRHAISDGRSTSDTETSPDSHDSDDTKTRLEELQTQISTLKLELRNHHRMRSSMIRRILNQKQHDQTKLQQRLEDFNKLSSAVQGWTKAIDVRLASAYHEAKLHFSLGATVIAEAMLLRGVSPHHPSLKRMITAFPDADLLPTSEQIEMLIDVSDQIAYHALALANGQIAALSSSSKEFIVEAQHVVQNMVDALGNQGVVCLKPISVEGHYKRYPNLLDSQSRHQLQEEAHLSALVDDNTNTNQKPLSVPGTEIPQTTLTLPLSRLKTVDLYLSSIPRTELATKGIDSGQRIHIDLGCGDGEHALAHARKHYDRDVVIGCDILGHRLATMLLNARVYRQSVNDTTAVDNDKTDGYQSGTHPHNQPSAALLIKRGKDILNLPTGVHHRISQAVQTFAKNADVPIAEIITTLKQHILEPERVEQQKQLDEQLHASDRPLHQYCTPAAVFKTIFSPEVLMESSTSFETQPRAQNSPNKLNNLYAYRGHGSTLLGSLDIASVDVIHIMHPPPPSSDSYFGRPIHRAAPEDNGGYSDEVEQSTNADDIASSYDSHPTLTRLHNHRGEIDLSLLNRHNDTLLSEQLLLIAARCLKPNGSIYILSDDNRVSLWIDRILGPHKQHEVDPSIRQRYTKLLADDNVNYDDIPYDDGEVNLARFFTVEELELSQSGDDGDDSDLTNVKSRYQRLHQQGKLKNKPHSGNSVSKAYRIVRNSEPWL